MGKKINLLGQKFGKLLVIEETSMRKNGSVVWKCQCDCGNIHYTSTKCLKQGECLSCGCSKKENGLINLLGQRFGKLLVIEKTNKRKWKSAVWKCQCDCGNIIEVDSHSLRKGNTQSCGCLKSQGELKIIQILQELNITYEYQKYQQIGDTFCYFDFYIPSLNLVIEYDGKQHFVSIDAFGGTERLRQQQERDFNKNQYCKEHNINILRIPYVDYKKLNKNYLLEKIQGGDLNGFEN